MAREKGTFVVKVTFTDEAGTAVTPDSINWTLTNTAGTVINSRTQVSVASPASTIYIVLTALDLAIPDAEDLLRIVTVEIVYDSDRGNDLPQKDEDNFTMKPLPFIT